jgi:hypothetical protein
MYIQRLSIKTVDHRQITTRLKTFLSHVYRLINSDSILTKLSFILKMSQDVPRELFRYFKYITSHYLSS